MSDYAMHTYTRPLSDMPAERTLQPWKPLTNLFVGTLLYSEGLYGQKWKSLVGSMSNNPTGCGPSSEYLQGCIAPDSKIWTIFYGACPVGYEAINPLIIDFDSVCSLNSRNLNVTGLTQSTSLAVSCTDGNPANYELTLTGNNTTNGLLNSGNGVSA